MCEHDLDKQITENRDNMYLQKRYKYAKVAYESYVKAMNLGTYLWEDLPTNARDAWFVAAEAVIEKYNIQFDDDLK